MTNVATPAQASKQVFRVTVLSSELFDILVEAASADEAKKLAEHIDAQYFRPDWNNTDWEVVTAELATDYRPDQIAPPEAYGSI